MVGGAALRNCPVEEALCGGHGEKGRGRHAARGLAEEGDVVGVAAEGRDVRRDPAKRRDLIELARVRIGIVGAQVAEESEAVVDRDQHDVVSSADCGAFVERLRAGSGHEPAAMDPEEHGALRIVGRG